MHQLNASTGAPSNKNTKENLRYLVAAIKRLNWVTIKQQVTEFWRKADENRLKQVAIVCGVIVGFLLLLGTVLYQLNTPKISWADSFLTSALLLLGGFGDLFGGFDFSFPVPLWLRFISLGMAIIGTAFVGILYGFLTERILAARFQLNKRRPPVPQQDHVVVVGLGRVGQHGGTLRRHPLCEGACGQQRL